MTQSQDRERLLEQDNGDEKAIAWLASLAFVCLFGVVFWALFVL